MGILSWLTGHDSSSEKKLVADFDKVDTVVTGLNEAATTDMDSAIDAMSQAVTELNNVNGMAQFVGTVDVGMFTETLESIKTAITESATKIQNTANDIRTFDEAGPLEKLFSTIGMGAAKVGEGFLSVFEDIGDGVVSLVGWLAPKDSGVEKWCTKFVEKEWSHDVFNFYYESDFAKKSLFTEDSGLAGACKLGGSVAGYLFLGGVASGTGSAIATKAAGSTAKVAQGVTKVATTMGKLASSTTWGATAVAGMAGLGSGTESGIREQLIANGGDIDAVDINSAVTSKGLKQGAVQGLFAFAGGKLGEKLAKNSAIKAATDKVDDATKLADDAASQLDDALAARDGLKEAGLKAEQKLADAQADLVKANNELTESMINNGNVPLSRVTNAENAVKAAQSEYDAAQQAFSEGVGKVSKATQVFDDAMGAQNAAEQALNTAKNAKLPSFQGYSDPITQYGQKVGTNATNNVLEQGLIKGTMTNVKAVAGAGIDTVKNVGGTTINAVTHPVETAGKVLTTAKNAGGSVVNAVTHPGTTIPAAINTVKAVATNPATPGVVAQTINSAISTKASNANIQFRDAVNVPTGAGKVDVTPADTTNQTFDVQPRIDTGPTGTTPTGTVPTGTTPPGGGGGYTPSGGGTTPTGTTPTGTTPTGTTPTLPTGVTPTGTAPTGTTPTLPTGTTPPPGTTTPPGGDYPIGGESPSGPGEDTHSGSGFGVDEFSGSPFAVDDEFEFEDEDALGDILDMGDSDMISKVPTSKTPIKNGSSSGMNAVIPIAAGLSAAAAAGIGAKAYMDRKNNSDNGEEEDDFDTDDWSEDQVDLGYDNNESIASQYLNDEDDYAYTNEEPEEKYDARSNEELTDF